MLDFTYMGRMLSGSKSDYARRNPTHVVVFNANICTKSKGKVWYGDVDVHKDIKELKRFASEQGETLYILREMAARFENQNSPKFEAAVVSIEADGTIDWKTPNTISN